MSREDTGTNGGIGFVGLLQLAFIILKLCNVITWKWVFVLMPLIISSGITLLVLLVVVLIALFKKST